MLEDAVSHTFWIPQCSYLPAAKQLYRHILPVSSLKYRDLCRLCDTNVIPGEFHRQYQELKTDCNVRDCLPETDDEDDV